MQRDDFRIITFIDMKTLFYRIFSSIVCTRVKLASKFYNYLNRKIIISYSQVPSKAIFHHNFPRKTAEKLYPIKYAHCLFSVHHVQHVLHAAGAGPLVHHLLHPHRRHPPRPRRHPHFRHRRVRHDVVPSKCEIQYFTYTVSFGSEKPICLHIYTYGFIDDWMKCVKRMLLYSENINITYPEIDADLVAWIRVKQKGLTYECMKVYIVLVSVLGSLLS